MNAEEKRLVKTASQNLRLDDIILFSARFERPSPIPENADAELSQQYKRSVRYSIDSVDDDRTLSVKVALGTRLIGQADEEREGSAADNVVILIEAEFVAVYDMAAEAPDNAIEAFARLNAVHNVWPFWRQHTFDVCKRGSLPSLDVPLIEPNQ